MSREVCLAFLLCAGAPAADGPVKATVCEIAKRPEAFDGKMVRVRAVVDTGLQDLPSGMIDESCGGQLKFYAPGDQDLVRLGRSKGFKKLVKDTKKNPVVEATVTGLFKSAIPGQTADQKPEPGLAVETVEDVVVIPQPHVKGQKR
jgi:hypothetical protein